MRDDFEFNVQFCELIRQFPAIYDFSRQDYCNRSVQENAWSHIAGATGETISNCKDRWKNIRGRYGKYKKTVSPSLSSDAKQVREYYLAPHLQFLDNFLRSRPPKSSSHSSQIRADGEDGAYFHPEVGEEGESLQEDPASPSSQSSLLTGQIQPASPPEVDTKKRKLGVYGHSEYRYFEPEQKLLVPQECSNAFDPDMAFLQSLLPDLKSMTDKQKRQFKIGILNLADKILD